MKKLWSKFGLSLILISLTVQSGGATRGGPPDEDEPLIVRVVHPDRQAAAVLRLFEGSRAASPAAALATWKQATRNPGQLGKPLEAVIAMCNPDMVAEWRVLDGAELHLGFDPAMGRRIGSRSSHTTMARLRPRSPRRGSPIPTTNRSGKPVVKCRWRGSGVRASPWLPRSARG